MVSVSYGTGGLGPTMEPSQAGPATQDNGDFSGNSALKSALGSGDFITLFDFEQVENICADPRGLGVPTLIPVPINLPTNTRKPMSVRGTPLANLGMGEAETPIRAEVGASHHLAAGQLRAMNAIIAGKTFRHLRPDLNESCIQIQGNVAPWTRETGGANERPNFATCSGNEL